eukprot:CAMPEP_0171600530 /NCGR_PEP_ID=MMETSP0990-20121206/4381_1 /TAXON_ID=483369 /ORGANISM="non described non described, Strain CCMP2098" /LENGTH=138 /DNA_ID=CAMNT_0012162511 /DNA_START=98 /DNA_END=515 /DNA_ORIENTATION=-
MKLLPILQSSKSRTRGNPLPGFLKAQLGSVGLLQGETRGVHQAAARLARIDQCLPVPTVHQGASVPDHDEPPPGPRQGHAEPPRITEEAWEPAALERTAEKTTSPASRPWNASTVETFTASRSPRAWSADAMRSTCSA